MEMKEFYNRPKLQDFFFFLRVPGPEGPSKTEIQFTDADFAKFSSGEKERRKIKYLTVASAIQRNNKFQI